MTSTLSVQRIRLRAGDSLPTFAAIIEDHNGVACDLTGAVCYLQVVTEAGVLYENEATVATAVTGTVVYDWTGTETALWGKGVHVLRVRVAWANGDKLIAPSSDGEAVLTIGAALPVI